MLKEIIEEVKNESSLSRVHQHYVEHQTGTISAFRYALECGEGKELSKKENLKRNNELYSWLIKKGYGLTSIDGTYIENFGTPEAREVDENSYFVVDLKDNKNLKKDLLVIGSKYEQDSITFSEPNGEYHLISSNECPKAYPGEGEIGIEENLGKPKFGKANKGDDLFFSKIRGRGFVFKKLGENNVSFDKLSRAEKLSVIKISERVSEDKAL